ncbi:hypothetical protein ILUMI_25903 [Ignelater luminosus]|uniref:HTH CENPB-type domain-containing protein n=1 Tax=Ignelater luminosus TaxID=2038154 RepID=A0A8K0C4B1_IGNLU|nr:hypothetical protein ILUMI_25903 [Ignelater luminosus]
MPCKAKTNRKLSGCDGELIKSGVLKVINDVRSIRGVAKETGICHQTLKIYVFKYKNSAPENRKTLRFTPNYEINKVFPNKLESLLEDYLIKACKLHHGLTRNDVKKLAYQMAVKNKLKYPVSWNKLEMAGKDWLNGLRSRYQEILIRKPEGTSLPRATAFNETNVNEFFNNLSEVYQRFPNLACSDSYNLDETALTTVHNSPKILGPKGQKQIGQVTSRERGILVTACCIINAAGQSVPPYFIFLRVNFKRHMLNGALNGSGGNASKSILTSSQALYQPSEAINQSPTSHPAPSNTTALLPESVQQVDLPLLTTKPGLSNTSIILRTPEKKKPTKLLTPELIKPYPKPPPRKTNISRRKKGKSKILVDSPIKNKIIEELKQREMKNRNKKDCQKKIKTEKQRAKL